jgi:hypothetical protein
MSREVLDTLFKQYEVAFDKLDLKAISDHYADTFISAGPKGTITQNKTEFLTRTEETANFYKSVGQNSARIISKRVMPICEKYNMVVIRWGVTFEKTGAKPMEFDVTYIVHETDPDPKIILFITHEDEEMAMKKLGVKPIITDEAH